MKLKSALDWNNISTDLKSQLGSIRFNMDLKKMYDNIQLMVSELSRNEVKFKRKHYYLEEQINKINQAIDHLQKLILIAKIMD